MTMYTLTLLCTLGLIAALQVPGTSAFWFFDSSSEEDTGRGGGGGISTGATSSEQAEIVNKHNELRRKPSASNMLQMSWSSAAAANAQRWANTCSMEHSSKSSRKISTSGCGENLYMSKFKNSWSNAIQSWYNEVKDWRYGVGSTNGGVVGHFTQVVWYRSNQVGCAMAHCPNSRKYKYFYVCHYCPPGNYGYTHPYRPGRTCGDCPRACNNRLCTNPCPYLDQYNNCASLKRQSGCSGKVGSWCPASCKCSGKII